MTLALAQHGAFTIGQACALGVSASGVQARVAAARLHRIHRGVYSIVPERLMTREGLFMAAVLAAGTGGALSHRSAASLLGLRPGSSRKIDVIVPTRVQRKRPGLDIHRSVTLTPADVATVENIPCTTVSRTLLDLADAVSRRSLERAFDQAETMDQFDLLALDDQVERNRSRPAARCVRAVLEEHYIGRTPTWSELEEALLPLIGAADLPIPQVNGWIVLPDGGPAIRADFTWHAERVVVETDGLRTHRTHQAFERDRRNDQRLQAAGWRVIRVTWKQIRDEPRRVVETIAALLGRSAERPGPSESIAERRRSTGPPALLVRASR